MPLLCAASTILRIQLMQIKVGAILRVKMANEREGNVHTSDACIPHVGLVGLGSSGGD